MTVQAAPLLEVCFEAIGLVLPRFVAGPVAGERIADA